MTRMLPMIVGVAAAAFATVANAQESESRIRSAQSNTQVLGAPGGFLIFTISGQPNDQVVSPWYCGKLSNAPFVQSVVHHSGGDYSYRLCVPFNAGWAGQTVQVSRGGQLIDRDRIVCR